MDSNTFTEDSYEDYIAEVVGEHCDEERDAAIDDESEEEVLEEEEWVPARHRKPLVRNRIVSSLDKSLDKDNYEIHNLNSQVIEYKSVLEKPRRKHDAGKSITWVNRRVGTLTDVLVTPSLGYLTEEARAIDTE